MCGRKRLLVADDDRDFITWLRSRLEVEGYEVLSAFDGETALRRAADDQPDLVLLDVIMPKLSGREVSRELRRAGNRVPIVMLTRLNEPHQEAGGLDDGADDYVCKPFEFQVLLARIRARLRAVAHAPGPDARYLRVGDRVFDREALLLFTPDGVQRPLAPNVAKLLRYFILNRGQLLSRSQILGAVWGYDFVGSERVVDQHVSRLNQALRDDAFAAPRLIRAVKGEGYIFDGAVTPVAWR